MSSMEVSIDALLRSDDTPLPWSAASDPQREQRNHFVPSAAKTLKFPMSFDGATAWTGGSIGPVSEPKLMLLTDWSLCQFDRRYWSHVRTAVSVMCSVLAPTAVVPCVGDESTSFSMGHISLVWYALLTLMVDNGDDMWLKSCDWAKSGLIEFVVACYNRVIALLARSQACLSEILDEAPESLCALRQPLGCGPRMLVDVRRETVWACASVLLGSRALWPVARSYVMDFNVDIGFRAAAYALPEDIRHQLYHPGSVMHTPILDDGPSLFSVLPNDGVSPAILLLIMLALKVDINSISDISMGYPLPSMRALIRNWCTDPEDAPIAVNGLGAEFAFMDMLSCLLKHDCVRQVIPSMMPNRCAQLRETMPHYISTDVLMTSAPLASITLHDDYVVQDLLCPLSPADVKFLSSRRAALSMLPVMVDAFPSPSYKWCQVFLDRMWPVDRPAAVAVVVHSTVYMEELLDYICSLRFSSAIRGDCWWVKPEVMMPCRAHLYVHPLALRIMALRSMQTQVLLPVARTNSTPFTCSWFTFAREILTVSAVRNHAARADLAAAVCDSMYCWLAKMVPKKPVLSFVTCADTFAFKLSREVYSDAHGVPPLTVADAACCVFLRPMFETMIPRLFTPERLTTMSYLIEGLLSSVSAMCRAPDPERIPRWPPEMLRAYLRYAWRRYNQWMNYADLPHNDQIEPIFTSNPHMLQGLAWLYMWSIASFAEVHQWSNAAPRTAGSERNRRKGARDNAEEYDCDERNAWASHAKFKRVYYHRGLRTNMNHIEDRFRADHDHGTMTTDNADLMGKLEAAKNQAKGVGDVRGNPVQLDCLCDGRKRDTWRTLRQVALDTIAGGRSFPTLADAFNEYSGYHTKRAIERSGKYACKTRKENPAEDDDGDESHSSSDSIQYDNDELPPASSPSSSRKKRNNTINSISYFILYSMIDIGPVDRHGRSHPLSLAMLGTCHLSNCGGNRDLTWTCTSKAARQLDTHLSTAMRLVKTHAEGTLIHGIYSLADHCVVSGVSADASMHALQLIGRSALYLETASHVPLNSVRLSFDMMVGDIPNVEKLKTWFACDVPCANPHIGALRNDATLDEMYLPYTATMTHVRSKWPELVKLDPATRKAVTDESSFTVTRYMFRNLPGLDQVCPGDGARTLAEFTSRVDVMAIQQ